MEKVRFIQEKLIVNQSQQKDYVDKKAVDMKFEKEERLLLKVSSIKCVMRFDRKGKLSPRYIGPFEVLKEVG